jgi:MoxR-like ATPase
MLSYTKSFDPGPTVIIKTPPSEEVPADKDRYAGDRRDGRVYVYDEDIVLAVNVALTVKRPLLIRGASGSGKSSLAQNIARFFKWRYYEVVISSGTQARDLLWQFDTLRRLSDAQGPGVKDDVYYIQPAVLWWAFDPESARRRGVSEKALKEKGIDKDKDFFLEDPQKGDQHARAVVLLDEIDKADPDTPNNLLVPLGSQEFLVPEADAKITATEPPLVIITSNDERELPNAFLRRCIMLNLKAPDRKRLVQIARAHFGKGNVKLYEDIAKLIIPDENEQAQTNDTEAKPQQSAAEYLDTVHACIKLGINPDQKDKTWQALAKVTLSKPRDLPGAV